MELLEREAGLRALHGWLRQADAGDGRLVFVGAEAGGGKTALLRRFAAELGPQSRPIAVSCDGLSTPEPLGPLLDAAPQLGLPVSQLLAEGASRDRLFRAVLTALDAAPNTTVILAEDAHWADEASLGLLRFLARHLAGRRLLLVVTYRDDELWSSHPLRQLLGDLATDPRVQRLLLPPLTPETVRRLAAAGGLDPDELLRRTGGNPFFVSEVLALGGNGVPPTVRDVVLARASRLSPPARRVLEIAAVFGSPLEPDLLLRVSGPVHTELEECLASGLLIAHGDALAFRHELTRDAIATAIAPSRRRLLHAAVLVALRERPGDARELARLAHHAEAAGDPAAFALAIAAAEQASALHANREAAGQYARALRCAGSLPDDSLANLYEARSVACYLSDQGRDAVAARQTALAIRRRSGDRVKEGDNLRWLSRVHWFNGQRAEAEVAGREAVRLLESEPPGPELAMAYSNLSQLGMLASDLDGAIVWGERAIVLASALGEEETLIHATINVGTARLQTGDPAGRTEIERALARADAAGLIDHAARARTNLAWDAVTEFQATAERDLDAALAYATEHDLDNYRRYLLAHRALLACRRGAWDSALDEVAPLVQQEGLSPLTRIVALTVAGTIRSRRGLPEADTALDEALQLAETAGELQRIAPVRIVRAERAWLAGDHDAARASLDPVRDAVFRAGSPAVKGELASLLARLGEHDVPTAGLPDPFARQIAGDWAGAAARWETRGYPWETAVALLEGDESAVRRALAIFERLRAKPAAALAVRRLRALGARGIPRGPYAAARTNPAGLTAREADVLAGLVAGLRNAEIAQRLFVTPKTVEHHVSAVFSKLGVRSRAEAIVAAGQIAMAESGEAGGEIPG